MIARILLLPVVAGLFALSLVAAPAQAQTDAERRIDRLEKTIKTLQAVVFQAQATGQPVVVKPEGPDPEIAALRQRIDDIDESRRGLTGQIETLTHDVQEATRARAADQADAAARIRTLNDRIAKLETDLAAAQAPPTTALDTTPPPPPVDPRTARGRAGADATARAQAADSGVLGTLRTTPVNDDVGAYRDARALLTSGDYSAATAAFQDYVARYPDSTRTPEAYYWLGETYYLREAYRQSTGAYAAALKSKPKTSWAADAMVRLSESLAQTNQADQACAAVDEFDRAYAAKASAAVKTRAAAVRRRAKCG